MLGGIALEKVHQCKYLDIHISDDLRWDLHIESVNSLYETLQHLIQTLRENVLTALADPASIADEGPKAYAVLQ